MRACGCALKRAAVCDIRVHSRVFVYARMENNSVDESEYSLTSLLELSRSGLLTEEETLDSLESLSNDDSYSLESSFEDVESDPDDPDFHGSDNLRDPLYEGSNFTTWDGYLRIMNFCLRHTLTKAAVSDLLELIASLLPVAKLTSQYKLNKTFLDMYKDIFFVTHYCCLHCHCPLDKSDSSCENGCNDGHIEFLSISVGPQLQRKLQGDENLLNIIIYSFVRRLLFLQIQESGLL